MGEIVPSTFFLNVSRASSTNMQQPPTLNHVSTLKAAAFALAHPLKQRFTCPICKYNGPFRNFRPSTGKRIHARCPNCGALERHRLQFLVVNKIFANINTKALRMIHFAPESFFQDMFRTNFGTYETADIAMPGVDHTVDLQFLPFQANSYDVVYASHVLEHIPDDYKAISEIRRILAPGGVAILPVPIVNPVTVEYPEPNPNETMHVRAPGPDYFDRYKKYFDDIDLYRSDDFSERYQIFAYADMTNLPSSDSPLRTAIPGKRHSDTVPVCHVAHIAPL